MSLIQGYGSDEDEQPVPFNDKDAFNLSSASARTGPSSQKQIPSQSQIASAPGVLDRVSLPLFLAAVLKSTGYNEFIECFDGQT